jgi:hypothetical protein
MVNKSKRKIKKRIAKKKKINPNLIPMNIPPEFLSLPRFGRYNPNVFYGGTQGQSDLAHYRNAINSGKATYQPKNPKHPGGDNYDPGGFGGGFTPKPGGGGGPKPGGGFGGGGGKGTKGPGKNSHFGMDDNGFQFIGRGGGGLGLRQRLAMGNTDLLSAMHGPSGLEIDKNLQRTNASIDSLTGTKSALTSQLDSAKSTETTLKNQVNEIKTEIDKTKAATQKVETEQKITHEKNKVEEELEDVKSKFDLLNLENVSEDAKDAVAQFKKFGYDKLDQLKKEQVANEMDKESKLKPEEKEKIAKSVNQQIADSKKASTINQLMSGTDEYYQEQIKEMMKNSQEELDRDMFTQIQVDNDIAHTRHIFPNAVTQLRTQIDNGESLWNRWLSNPEHKRWVAMAAKETDTLYNRLIYYQFYEYAQGVGAIDQSSPAEVKMIELSNEYPPPSLLLDTGEPYWTPKDRVIPFDAGNKFIKYRRVDNLHGQSTNFKVYSRPGLNIKGPKPTTEKAEIQTDATGGPNFSTRLRLPETNFKDDKKPVAKLFNKLAPKQEEKQEEKQEVEELPQTKPRTNLFGKELPQTKPLPKISLSRQGFGKNIPIPPVSDARPFKVVEYNIFDKKYLAPDPEDPNSEQMRKRLETLFTVEPTDNPESIRWAHNELIRLKKIHKTNMFPTLRFNDFHEYTTWKNPNENENDPSLPAFLHNKYQKQKQLPSTAFIIGQKNPHPTTEAEKEYAKQYPDYQFGKDLLGFNPRAKPQTQSGEHKPELKLSTFDPISFLPADEIQEPIPVIPIRPTVQEENIIFPNVSPLIPDLLSGIEQVNQQAEAFNQHMQDILSTPRANKQRIQPTPEQTTPQSTPQQTPNTTPKTRSNSRRLRTPTLDETRNPVIKSLPPKREFNYKQKPIPLKKPEILEEINHAYDPGLNEGTNEKVDIQQSGIQDVPDSSHIKDPRKTDNGQDEDFDKYEFSSGDDNSIC